MKIKAHIINIVSFLLILLWIYTSINKVMDVTVFKSQLAKQAWIGAYAGFFVWFLPAIEILAALLLMFAITKKAGMLLSFLMMTVFTGYVALAVAGYWENIPCSCGGVLNQLGWKDHLWFNLFFTAIAGLGVFLLFSERFVYNWKILSFRKNLFRPKRPIK